MLRKVILLWYGLCVSLGINGVYTTDTQCPDLLHEPEDRREDNTLFRLMQYNVEWLFLDYYSNADCPGNGCTWKNMSEANIHLKYVYDVIYDVNPTFINFCEIEGCDELNTLKEMLQANYESYLIQGTDTATGQNVGLLTKIDPQISIKRTNNKYTYPLQDSECDYDGKPSTTGVSKHYISEFIISGIKVCIIGAHLIAYPTDSSRCAKREAQASILQEVIYNYTKNGYEVIMMGDFNDFDNTVLDMNNDMPNSHVLDILKGIKGPLKHSYELSSVAASIPQQMRFSDWYDSDNNCDTHSKNDYSMIDHILISPGLQQYVTNVEIYHKYFIYCGKYNSDHYPVIVDFDFGTSEDN